MTVARDADAGAIDRAAGVRVWDRVVRVLHWSLAGSVGMAGASLIDALCLQPLHQPAGYAALGIVLLRVVWGGVGRGHARFAQFVRGPRVTARYARLVFARREPRTLGHNPLGAWMIVALLLCVIALAISGWLYTTDWFWGSEAVEDVHRQLAWSLLALVALHIGGVIYTSWRHRENLVKAMFDGRKRAGDEH